MQLAFLTALALLVPALAYPIANTTEEVPASVVSEIPQTEWESDLPNMDIAGTSRGVEFPFSDEAIDSIVMLGADVAALVLDDSIYFINTTIADAASEV